MGIVAVREIHFGRTHQARATGQRTFTRHFQVQTDNPRTSQLQVRLATGIPRLFDIYNTGLESDNWCFVESIQVDQERNNLNTWYITVNYSSISTDPVYTRPLNQVAGSPGQGQPTSSPTSEPDKYQWYSETVKKYVEKDIAGTEIKNSAGDFFNPPLSENRYILILKVTRQLATFDGPTMMQYKDCVNTYAWNGFPPYHCLISDINAQSQFQDNVSFWLVTFTFKIQPTIPWVPTKILDRGFYQKKAGSNVNVPIYSPTTAQPTTIPRRLDGTGFKLADTAPGVYLDFYLYYDIDFSPLAITLP